jgi:hypothetical protein
MLYKFVEGILENSSTAAESLMKRCSGLVGLFQG